jgi:hypothetical protein
VVIDWRSRLVRDGYVMFPGMVPSDRIQAARSLIDRDLREQTDPARQVEYDHQTYCRDILSEPEISGLLLDTPIRGILDEAIGFDNLEHGQAQIAIRRARNATRAEEPEPHIDGVATPYNGVTTPYISNFTALVGIYLSDVTQEFAGNFTVWPGSHVLLEEYFRARGPGAAEAGMPSPDLGPSRQLLCSSGDVVLCHYQLMHTAAANLSPIDRYAVYFRLWLRGIEKRRWELLTHIWRGWKIGPVDERGVS